MAGELLICGAGTGLPAGLVAAAGQLGVELRRGTWAQVGPGSGVVALLTELYAPDGAEENVVTATHLHGVAVLLVVNDEQFALLDDAWDQVEFIAASACEAEWILRLSRLLRKAALAASTSAVVAPASTVPEPALAPTPPAPTAPATTAPAGTLIAGELVISPDHYTAAVRGRRLDLTYKEFELLAYLCANVGQVLTRPQLLHDVWGYDYYGGTRTVDVHIRRLRAKLAPDYDSAITTIRQVGYRFDPPLRGQPNYSQLVSDPPPGR